MGKQGDRITLQLHQQDFARGPFVYEDKLQSLRSGGFNITGAVAVFLKEIPGQPVNRSLR
jgi:hypothetical protein